MGKKDDKVVDRAKQVDQMLERLELSSVKMNNADKTAYIEQDDDLGWAKKGTEVDAGYKHCGKCGHIKKFFLFNKNKANKDCVTGTCKECQKASAKKSYKKTKKKRNYKRYYQENKEMKQAHSRKYYEENKEAVIAKQREYHASGRGKKVMRKAHAKRRAAIAANQGIPYTRAMVIERDSVFIESDLPICWLCGEPIEDTSGEGLHLDHVVSINNGGLDCFTNIACTHKVCNLKKEKDDRFLEAESVEEIVARAEAYMDENPDKFPDEEE